MLAIALGLVIGTLAWAVFVYRSDRFEREPMKTLLFVGAVGGLLSAIVATTCEVVFGLVTGIEFDLSGSGDVGNAAVLGVMAGVIEEFVKVFTTVMLIRRKPAFNEPVDGVIYAMTVALGFALFENAMYAIGGGLGTVVARSLTATPMHIGVAALWGAGIAKARFGGDDRWFKHIWPWFLAAASIHAVYNFAIFAFPTPLTMILVNVPCVVVLLVIARKITRRLSNQGPFRPDSYCVNCNRMNPENSSRCGYCGQSLARPTPGAPSSAGADAPQAPATGDNT